jgi:hypothetical protein
MKCSKRRDREEEERFQTNKKQANILSETSTFLQLQQFKKKYDA